MSIKISNHRVPVISGLLIFATVLLFTLNYIFATPITTPGLNYAGGRDGGANFSSVLQATGSDETVCATQGAAAAVQQFDNFGLTIHPSGVIHGIRVQVLGSISAGSETWSVFLRKNTSGAISPVTETASVTNNNACGSTQQTLTFGNLTGTFGQSWSASELDDDGFTVGISLPAAGAVTRRINWIRVEVNYSLPTTTTTITDTVTTTLTTTTTLSTTTTLTSTTTTTITSTQNVTSTFNTTLTSTSTTTTTLTSVFNTTSTLTTTTTIVDTTETCTSTVQTYVFYDGFESGNYSKWNQTSSGNLGSIAINSVNPINGTYDSKSVIGNNINGFGWAEGTANLTQFNSSPGFWMLFYNRVNPFVHNNNAETHFLEVRNSTGDILEMGYFHDAFGNHELEVELNNPVSGSQVLRSGPIMVGNNSIQKIELGFLRNTTGGYLKAYINGTLLIDYTPANNNYTAYNITAFRVGVMENAIGQKNFNATIDNVYVAKNRIGLICYPISTITTTSTISSTTTITAAVCSALLCANVDYYGEQSPWWIIGVLIGAMFGAVLVLARKRRNVS